ncbi:MAG: SAM-dependent methyltransferase [Verrucomicrobia bacterium]|nr:SAM-dependent methyltransferase [Verrucomicrobiota bacterium]
MSKPQHHRGALTELIRREIDAHETVPFARFMELALYAPGLGYYERDKVPIGRGGDFYTSVSVGSLFGELLAFQLAEWITECGMRNAECGMGAARVQLVEAGAHDGRLAADILGWMRRQRPDVLGRLEYWIIEPSAQRRQWQEKTLVEFLPGVRWADAAFRIPQSLFQSCSSRREEAPFPLKLEPPHVGCYGVLKSPSPSAFQILFCNELLDALPVHRLGWDAQQQQWFEWHVTWSQDRFVWARRPLASDLTPALRRLPAALCSALPDGYTVEISPAAVQWWRDAASFLKQGKLLAIDYGLTEEEWLAPHRPQGTLRAYQQHHQGNDVLADPGGQDLTAHIDFTALQRAGEAAGLKTEALVSQGQFMVGIASRVWAAPASFPAWTPARTRQFQTLTHPEHLGSRFRVLIQSRGNARLA